MNQFTKIIRTMPHSENMPDISGIKIPANFREYQEWQCRTENEMEGELQGYDCRKCLNKGYFMRINEDDVIVRCECECMRERNNPFRIELSGLKRLKKFDKFTFENYQTDTEWRKRTKSMAIEYVREHDGKWLFFGGGTGTGKTHLCTAVCKELIRQGHWLKYIIWRDLADFLTANRYNDNYSKNYQPKMQELTDIDILYIDDFLKTPDTKQLHTELNYAYELINSRDMNGKQTIISSELLIDDIRKLDDATAGRINENAQNFRIQIKNEDGRNFRYHGGKK